MQPGFITSRPAIGRRAPECLDGRDTVLCCPVLCCAVMGWAHHTPYHPCHAIRPTTTSPSPLPGAHRPLLPGTSGGYRLDRDCCSIGPAVLRQCMRSTANSTLSGQHCHCPPRLLPGGQTGSKHQPGSHVTSARPYLGTLSRSRRPGSRGAWCLSMFSAPACGMVWSAVRHRDALTPFGPRAQAGADPSEWASVVASKRDKQNATRFMLLSQVHGRLRASLTVYILL